MKQFWWLGLLYSAVALSQPRNFQLQFIPESRGNILSLHDTFPLGEADRAVLETLRFYVSGISLFNADTLVWSEPDSYHLYDSENPETINLVLPAGTLCSRISFYVGVDSITNVSGAMGGALDPVNGMYWTWQSGYINFKMEGRCQSSRHPKKEFQLHLGGYETPYNTLQKIDLAVGRAEQTLRVFFDVERLMNAADIARRSHIMSPCPEAVLLSRIMATCFFTHRP